MLSKPATLRKPKKETGASKRTDLKDTRFISR